MAIHDIKAGEEVCYDYNVREQEWMRARPRPSTPTPSSPTPSIERTSMLLFCSFSIYTATTTVISPRRTSPLKRKVKPRAKPKATPKRHVLRR